LNSFQPTFIIIVVSFDKSVIDLSITDYHSSGAEEKQNSLQWYGHVLRKEDNELGEEMYGA